MAMEYYIGCSGFHYKHWKNVFYPADLPQKRWFEHYCKFFNTLELNVTFYRFPRLPFVKAWHAESPDDFRFAVKAPRAITHFKKFLGTTAMLGDFYGTIQEGLAEKLGCVLFQLPPRLAYSEAFLDRVLAALDPTMPNGLEFRHESWWNAVVYRRLAEAGVTFCGMSHPQLPKDFVLNAPLVYYRFHGDEQLYASDYDREVLADAAQVLRSSAAGKREAYLYFNNDGFAHAVKNALELKALLELRPPYVASVTG